MPIARTLRSKFTPKEAARLAGLSVHMLNYLARHEYLVPSYGKASTRGKVRYYSYRDLVVARIVQKLLAAGLEVSRLKEGIRQLSTATAWVNSRRTEVLRMLITDGRQLYFANENGTLLELTQSGQMAFAFVIDVDTAKDEVKQGMSEDQIADFNMINRRA